MQNAFTIVISAAGMGTRLGMNVPKALVKVGGKTILARQLEIIEETENVVVVAGFRAQLLIDYLRQVRPDICVALNHEFASTGTAASVSKGSQFAENWVISLDGDLLVKKEDFRAILEYPGPCIGLTPARSKAPVWAERLTDGTVVSLSQSKESEWEWSGLAKIDKSVAKNLGQGHVFTGLKSHLPIASLIVDCVEIDDLDDLAYAEVWVRNNTGDSGAS